MFDAARERGWWADQQESDVVAQRLIDGDRIAVRASSRTRGRPWERMGCDGLNVLVLSVGRRLQM